MVTAEQLVNRMNTNQRSVVQIKSVWWCGEQASTETRLRSEDGSGGTEAISRWSVR